MQTSLKNISIIQTSVSKKGLTYKLKWIDLSWKKEFTTDLLCEIAQSHSFSANVSTVVFHQSPVRSCCYNNQNTALKCWDIAYVFILYLSLTQKRPFTQHKCLTAVCLTSFVASSLTLHSKNAPLFKNVFSYFKTHTVWKAPHAQYMRKRMD